MGIKTEEKPSAVPETPLEDGENREIRSFYENLIKKADDVRTRVVSDQGISPSPILSDLHSIIDHGYIDGLYEYAMSLPDQYDTMLVHTVDLTFASLKVGRGMAYDVKMLLKLGLAAFLENVGMYKIPDAILKKEEKLAKEEIRIIKNHPQVSSQILGRMGERYAWLADVALQIHERYDGSGYPRGLKGEEIDEMAAIIGLLDIYVAMIKMRSYRKKFIQTDAIKFIIKDAKGLFPAKIIKTFLNQISLFPVNTYVRLNNKSIGRVLSTDSGQPLKPNIELLYDSQGQKMAKRQIIRLAENPLLHIIEGIDEKEIP
jgi:HD-GYP domain-containing protein (c-di-GMP phosphodiesterase class II)